MTWPTSPPPMPGPGWYADPEQHSTWRWWDGSRWTDLRSPMGAPPAKDPYSFSAWFEQSTAAVKAVVRRVGLAIAGAYLVCAVATGVLFTAVYRSDEFGEIRRILQLDHLLDSGSMEPVELTEAEEDRVLDLLGDMARTWIPLLIVLGIVFALVITWATVVAARAAEAHRSDDDRPAGAIIVDDSATALAVSAIRRLPAVIASYLVVGAIVVVVLVALFVPLIVAAVAGGGGVAVGFTAVFGGLAAIVVLCFVGVRLSLAIPICAIGGHGLGITRSWELTEGRFWGVVGRLLVAGLIASVASAPVNIMGNAGFVFGTTVAVVVLVILQAVSSAASTLVTIPASVVLVHHLAEQRSDVGEGPIVG